MTKPRTIYKVEFGVRWTILLVLIAGFGLYGLASCVAAGFRMVTQ